MMNDRQLKLSNLLDTWDRRDFSSAGVIRFDVVLVRDITGHRLPRIIVSLDPSDRTDSLLGSARRVDIGGVGFGVSLA